MRKNYLYTLNFGLICIVIASIMFSGCKTSKKGKLQIEPGKVFFIEYIQTDEGTTITGKAPQGPRIDRPSYSYDRDKKTIQLNQQVRFSIDSCNIILGSGKILKGAAGSGASTQLSEIKKLPYNQGALTITKIDSKGMHFTYNNEKNTIPEGNEWNTSQTRTDTLKMAQPVVIETKSTIIIRYHGKIDKKSIVQ